MSWLDSIADSMDMSLSRLQEMVTRRRVGVGAEYREAGGDAGDDERFCGLIVVLVIQLYVRLLDLELQTKEGELM